MSGEKVLPSFLCFFHLVIWFGEISTQSDLNQHTVLNDFFLLYSTMDASFTWICEETNIYFCIIHNIKTFKCQRIFIITRYAVEVSF